LNTEKRTSRVYKKPTTPSAEKSKVSQVHTLSAYVHGYILIQPTPRMSFLQTELRHLFVPDPVR
jgi:hypothetical protein